MTALHAHYLLRNQQAFQRLLEASRNPYGAGGPNANSSSGGGGGQAGLSTSGSRSWNKHSYSPLNAFSSSASVFDVIDVNAKDWLGRTVLHLAVSALDSASLEYVRLLLGHPRIDVNVTDKESGWTPLHRAMYVGNLGASLLLLHHADIDTSVKDMEGYTAFELYNSTVEGTKPPEFNVSGPNAEEATLYMWGANRNAALGVGDSDDRAFPESIVLKKLSVEGHDAKDLEKKPLKERFGSVGVRDVRMSKVHTTVVTSENAGNVRQCGLGGGGRLGPHTHTQYTLVSHPYLIQQNIHIAQIALGQDHTIALTSDGEVFSWGLNRFSQLGYVVEPPSSGLRDGIDGLGGGGAGVMGLGGAQVQVTPRKVVLRGKIVRGVAACKTASACWTREEVFTWGSNAGQLGYDRSAHPVQVTPRKVPQLDVPVVGIALTEHAMACLLQTKDVICFWNDRHFKINFSTNSFPQEIQTYRPPMATNSAHIRKVTSCDGQFAALTINGEVFTFTLDAPSSGSGAGGEGSGGKGKIVVPQRVWALRKQYNAVRDVALGSDGSLILCTESGHVYVRSRGYKGGAAGAAGQMKPFKFQRIPYIQRVVKVAANETGALAALRVDARKEKLALSGRTLMAELGGVMPFLYTKKVDGEYARDTAEVDVTESRSPSIANDEDADEETADSGIQNDIRAARQMCDMLKRDKESRAQKGRGLFELSPGSASMSYGADLIVQVGGNVEFPVHRILLASRSSVLSGVILEKKTIKDGGITISGQKKASIKSPFRLVFSSCHALSVLILLRYFYMDELIAVWDRRIGLPLELELVALKCNVSQVKSDLQTFARMLSLHTLKQALDSPAKRVPPPSLSKDMRTLLQFSQSGNPVSYLHPLFADTILELRDRTVYCHSTILRARSPFFSSFFDEEEWTEKRWAHDRTVSLNLKHLSWRVMDFVLYYIYCDDKEEMFEVLDFVSTVDNVLDFMFEVMAAASELLLDRLSLVCSTIILQYTNLNNVCSILADATFYHATQLITSLHGYIACNLETLLESRMLEDLTPDLIKNLTSFINSRQAQKLSVSRSNKLVDEAMKKHTDWLKDQDIPQIMIPSTNNKVHMKSPKLSPVISARMRKQSSGLPSPSQVMTPMMLPQPAAAVRHTSSSEDIFSMDEPDLIPPLSLESQSPTPPNSVPKTWKASTTQGRRVDLKMIMTEAETERNQSQPVNAPTAGKRVVGFNITETGVAATSKVTAPSKAPPAAARMTPSSSMSSSSTAESSRSTPLSGLSQTRKDTPGVSGPPARPGMQSAATPPRAGPSTPTKRDLGPTFTPTRTPLSVRVPSSSRRASDTGGKVWSTPTVQPLTPPVPSTSPPSFAAIQQQQRAQDLEIKKPKQTLLQIQEEERARQEEADFLKWWTAEEERIRLEHETAASSVAAQPKSKRQKPKKSPSAKGKSTSTQRQPRPP